MGQPPADTAAPRGVTGSHEVAIFMGEFWLKKINYYPSTLTLLEKKKVP